MTKAYFSRILRIGRWNPRPRGTRQRSLQRGFNCCYISSIPDISKKLRFDIQIFNSHRCKLSLGNFKLLSAQGAEDFGHGKGNPISFVTSSCGRFGLPGKTVYSCDNGGPCPAQARRPAVPPATLDQKGQGSLRLTLLLRRG